MLTDDELKAVRDLYPSDDDESLTVEGKRIRAMLRHIDALHQQLAALRDPETLAAIELGAREIEASASWSHGEHQAHGYNYAARLRALLRAAIDAAKEPTPLPGEGE